jgi:signal transduction histidine kinase
MREETRVLLHMLLNLLDIAHADESGLTPHKRPVAVSELFTRVVRDLDVKAQVNSVKLAHFSEVDGVLCDPDLVTRVLENLVDNAIRHAPEHSEVRLSARALDGYVQLRVSDQGTGVAPEARARIFEPFVQLEHNERVVARTGRGLGLTFCKVAVEAHGGKIWIEDENPGSAFCLTLPLPN